MLRSFGVMVRVDIAYPKQVRPEAFSPFWTEDFMTKEGGLVCEVVATPSARRRPRLTHDVARCLGRRHASLLCILDKYPCIS